jgi:cytochrome c peroxidase
MSVVRWRKDRVICLLFSAALAPAQNAGSLKRALTGKALFRDMQAGSNGGTACAACHFHAGASATPSRTLAAADSPFHVLANRANNRPAVGRGGSHVRPQTFEELRNGTGTGGSRAHSLKSPCN